MIGWINMLWNGVINTYGFGPSQPFHLSKYKTIHLPSNKAVSEDDALVNSIELIKKQRSRSHGLQGGGGI